MELNVPSTTTLHAEVIALKRYTCALDSLSALTKICNDKTYWGRNYIFALKLLGKCCHCPYGVGDYALSHTTYYYRLLLARIHIV